MASNSAHIDHGTEKNNEPKRRLSLLNLNLDVLHEIIDAVIDAKADARGKLTRDKSSLQALAQANKFVRNLLLPELFKNVRVRGDWQRSLETMLAMNRCSHIMDNVQGFSWYVNPSHTTCPQGTNFLQ